MYDPSLFRLDNGVALITGAGAGIGRSIAETFAAAGAAVTVTDRDADASDSVARAIRDSGGRAISVACDVTKESDLEASINRTLEAFGKITMLINNAGGGGPKPFEMPMTDMRFTYELNFFSLFRLCQLAAPHIEQTGGGSIVNISSMSGENKNQRMASYASSKAAVNHLTRNIAFDLGPKNIRVNAIAPGATKTHALSTVLTPAIEQKMLTHTPLKRLGEPHDIAYAALFLCSPASSWISGQILTVSGGGIQELD